MYTIGIDCGLSGAVAILKENTLIEVWNLPTVEVQIGKSLKRRLSPELLVSELRCWDDVRVAYVEAISASPQMGVSSAFAFGEGYGIVKGVLSSLGISMVLVTPQRWKKDMKLNASKDGSRAKAIQLWPNQAHEFKRVKDADKAEAALIGYWGTTVSKAA